MSEALISREALKKQFEELHLHPDLIELIDNAPIVTPQAFYNGIIELVSKNGITSLDELLEILKKEASNNE